MADEETPKTDADATGVADLSTQTLTEGAGGPDRQAEE